MNLSDKTQGNCELIFEEFEDIDLNNSSIKASTSLNKLKTKKEPLPFVTRKCPSDYKIYGCCKCVKTCKSVHMHPREKDGTLMADSVDHNLYCQKPPSYKSEKFTEASRCVNIKCEVYADQFYVSKCKEGFTRVGADLCMAICPHGWPDLGEQCLKVGSVEVIPFPWMVGDEDNVERRMLSLVQDK